MSHWSEMNRRSQGTVKRMEDIPDRTDDIEEMRKFKECVDGLCKKQKKNNMRIVKSVVLYPAIIGLLIGFIVFCALSGGEMVVGVFPGVWGLIFCVYRIHVLSDDDEIY